MLIVEPKEIFMSKRSLLILGAVAAMTVSGAYAGVTFGVDNNNMGRVPIGETNYSTNRMYRIDEMRSNAVNDAMTEFPEESTKSGEKKITDVIKEPELRTPAASFKSSFSATKERKDASSQYGFGATNIPSGVNDSKTIYTDDLGRLHFFGKANQFKD